MDGRASLPNYWAPKGPRAPSIGQPHGIDNVFEFVSRGAGTADVIPGHEDYPDLYRVPSPTELGDALIWVGRKMVSLTQEDRGLN